jgi:hypothetical protein
MFENGTCAFTCSIGACSPGSASTSHPTSTSHLVLSKTEMATMDIDGIPSDQPATLHGLPQVQESPIIHTGIPLSNGMPPFPTIPARFSDCHTPRLDSSRCSGSQHREPFREIPVKVHIRRPERDSWVYVGRATVSLDTTGHSSQVGKSLHTQLHPTGQIF